MCVCVYVEIDACDGILMVLDRDGIRILLTPRRMEYPQQAIVAARHHISASRRISLVSTHACLGGLGERPFCRHRGVQGRQRACLLSVLGEFDPGRALGVCKAWLQEPKGL